ncbi:hypothetical protein GZH49_10900 [Nocardia terpenica]|uniref:hypothetical protein n=1 Tax=Nocardia terpenica TaxID=455432 RepID=UPI002FE28E10
MAFVGQRLTPRWHRVGVLLIAPMSAVLMSSCALIAVFETSVLFDGDVAFTWPTPKPLLDSDTAVFSLNLAENVIKESIPAPSPSDKRGPLDYGIKSEMIPIPPGVRPGDPVVCHVHVEDSLVKQGDTGPEARITNCRRAR